MNVFVLCTGRCGSLSFAKACGHIRNFTSGHESRCGMLGAERFNYPANHIEVDNRLSWLTGRLDRRFGTSAFYVHLKRDDEQTAHSYSRRMGRGIMNAYGGRGILMGVDEKVSPLDLAMDYVQTINSNIELFLRDKPHVLTFDIEQATQQFPEFCHRIDADVDIDAGIHEFERRYNAG